MATYNYENEYPFAAFITNHSAYVSGSLIGEWVKFPTTPEHIQNVFDRIGASAGNEWFITDYDCYVNGIHEILGGHENLDELNYFASNLQEMDEIQFETFQAAIEADNVHSVQDLINMTYKENLECYYYYPEIYEYSDLGRLCICELEAMEVPDYLIDYIDFEAYGRDVHFEGRGAFTNTGYISRVSDDFKELYHGNVEEIPEEYRVNTIPEQNRSLARESQLRTIISCVRI